VLLLASLVIFIWLAKAIKSTGKVKALTAPDQGSDTPSGTLQVGIPTLSALLGQDPKITFNPSQFFAQQYFSPLTAEFEKNIKLIAQRNYPNDKEGFYARFIGVGIVAYQNDVTWFTIYKSQLGALQELNARNVPIPIADVRKHYDKAVGDHPKTFANYSFDQWLGYMTARLLALRHPSEMVEITHGGRDFLKYVAHRGWNINGKRN
jgi:hypothetical protein